MVQSRTLPTLEIPILLSMGEGVGTGEATAAEAEDPQGSPEGGQ